MRLPRLAALELKRFGRGRLPRAALAAMLLLPLLYGALYLWSFWDPYARLDKIPVALVNDDQGATAQGEKVAAGDSIAQGLRDSDTFDWQETSAAEARKGIEDGRYYLSLRIPADFSKRVSSSSGDSPETGALKVEANDANNYIVGQISRSVFSEVRASASSKVSRGFYDKIFVSFSSLHGETAKAAKGADDLGAGIGKAKKGAADLKRGLSDAKGGSGKLKTGTRDLHSGAGSLQKGAKRVAGGTQKLADKVNKADGAAREVRSYLKEHGGDIGKATRDVARTSKQLRADLKRLPGEAASARTASRRSADALGKLHTAQCTGAPEPGPGCPELKKAADASEQAAKVAASVDDAVRNHRSADALDRRLKDLDRKAGRLAQRAPALGQDIDTAVQQINTLNRGAQQVAKGAGTLRSGLATAQSGAAGLDTGLGKLSKGAASLDGGLFQLADGSSKLAGGLHDGVKKIPDYGKKQREDRSGVMADPVGLVSGKAHAAPNYGTGFAPYFIPLSLWVGAMVAYMLLQPLNKRALAAGAPGWRIALAGWLPVAAIGTVQVAALMSVLHWGLGLHMARGAGTVGFLLLVTVCFTSLVQFLNARFGPAGRILVLAMLMLQLTSAGGTYPIQTSPGFFNALHPFLPMTYVVEGLRHLITGGGLGPVWRACGVLLAFTAGALALTAVTARRKQVWSLNRLRPELTL
ncbi:YhgE/Pip family protein [Streptomyces boncukensis]|uniref:YhgE/Pip domain-containing protein n=1 Tax=Streptomyces boncukensis TaxID=2711219 RepID=A0A6G4X4X1_9ACTN|nr:YhgE/Pip domain-containing protein [Streptomyces boncukensis]NGO71711.1 YhgE/Pip domain-containing protein [Streptomyces boncukensis]